MSSKNRALAGRESWKGFIFGFSAEEPKLESIRRKKRKIRKREKRKTRGRRELLWSVKRKIGNE